MRPWFLAAIVLLAVVSPAFALDGQVTMHDPATIMLCDGKYYTYGTGGSPLVSEDGWTWTRGVTPPRTGAAPDVIHVGDRYFMYISGVTMISNKTLDPNSPDYQWEDGGRIVGMEGPDDFMNPIDPGAFLDPNDGKLWVVYGSYFGYLRVVELDPETGQRVDPPQPPVNVAINCEASTIIYRDGWYYLLATHGSCCSGSSSSYNIRVGRSKKVTGPYIDNMGIDMLQGGGKLFCGSSGRHIGAGHFGLLDLGDGVQRFSLHWEADLDRGGASVVDILPLLWKDGWPVAGKNFQEGTFQIESVRTGTALELAVEGVPVGRAGGGGGRGGMGGMRGGMGGGARGAGGGAPAAAPDGEAATSTPTLFLAGAVAPGEAPATRGAMGAGGGAAARGGMGGGARAGMGGGMGGGFGGGGRGMFGGQGGVVPDQDVEVVSANWPEGDVGVRMAIYMCQAQQKWTVAPVADAGGYPGSPYFKITVAGTDRTLAMGEDRELIALPEFTGGDEQLWRLDQLTDGTWRIMPKITSIAGEKLALSAIGSSFATLEEFDPDSEKQRWVFKTP